VIKCLKQGPNEDEEEGLKIFTGACARAIRPRRPMSRALIIRCFFDASDIDWAGWPLQDQPEVGIKVETRRFLTRNLCGDEYLLRSRRARVARITLTIWGRPPHSHGG